MSRESPEEKRARLERNRMYLDMNYEGKVILARARVKEWQRICKRDGKKYAVSVGGLDSITLLAFCREVLQEDVPGVSVSILEDKSIQMVHKEMGVIPVPPLKTKAAILQEYGFPVISKQTAAKIERLQTPGDNSPIIKAYMTGDTGPWGHYGHNDKFKIPDKWIAKFGGLYADMRPDLECKVAPFKVSDKCCYWLKELPLKQYNEEHKIYPFWGIMQSEGGRRQYSLRMHGCNYVGKTTARSAPFNYFNRQDLLQLAIDLHVHVPEIYGEIKPDLNGDLQTTKAQRTGCSMCGFGIHLDRRPHHFDMLRQDNPKEWEYWMYNCCIDEKGEKYGWGRVLDWIGVEWETPWQMRLF